MIVLGKKVEPEEQTWAVFEAAFYAGIITGFLLWEIITKSQGG